MESKSKIVSCLFLIVLFVMALTMLVSCSPKFSEWEITKQPTCTEDGEMVRYKKGGKHETETKVIPAKGHIYPDDGAWHIVEGKEPTHTTEGEEMRTCSRCHQSETRPVQPIGYDYILKIVDGKKTVQTIYLKDGEEYAVDAEFLKTGYRFTGLKDGDNDFPLSGVISENKTVTVEWEILPTTTFLELSERLAAGVDKIFIDADIEMTGSVYVVGNTEIYVAENHTVRRAAGFLGDMFVIGETPNGENSFLVSGGIIASLDLKTLNAATLTFDGNKAAVTGEVNGTCFLVLYSATVNMYDGIVVQNFKKTANSKIVNDGYKVSYPNKIGGAGMIVANGTFNMYGGRFVGNEVNVDETFDGDETESEARVSSCGGAIYNYAGVNVYGGEFVNNQAARGGAIYNYRTANVYKGTFTDNSASVYAGAVYLPGSQYTSLHIGNILGQTSDLDGDGETAEVLFDGNRAGKSGGALFGQMKNSINIYGGVTFKNNVAERNNGGAINTSGAIIIEDAVFEGNTAASKGGAIYAYYSNKDLTTRQVEINSGTFKNNQASKGGAIAFSASSVEFPRGSIGFLKDVTFEGNEAYATETDDPELPGGGEDDDAAQGKNYNGNGGAIYISRKSNVTISGNARFVLNVAERNGGAIYVTGEANLSVMYADGKEVLFDGNSATTQHGGAIYAHGEGTVFNVVAATGVDGGTQTSQKGVVFKNNSAENKGGAIYATNGSDRLSDPTTGVFINVNNSKFEANTSGANGGAIYFYKDARFNIAGSEFLSNVANGSEYGGGAVYSTTANGSISTSTFKTNTATKQNGGAIGVYSESTLQIISCEFNGNYTQSASANGGGAMYISGSDVTVTDSKFIGNTSKKNGGAVGVYSGADVKFRGDNEFTSNTAKSNGGALYVSSSGTKVTFNNSVKFDKNVGLNGGAVYVTGPSTVTFNEVIATENKATEKGGFLFYKTTNTVVTINEGSATGNTAATGGSAIWSDTNKATLKVKGSAGNTLFKIEEVSVIYKDNENNDILNANINNGSGENGIDNANDRAKVKIEYLGDAQTNE